MYIIAGLGNPGSKYEGTRHNMGFDVIDRLVEEYKVPQGGVKFEALTGVGTIGVQRVLLAKPLTYMNESGRSVRAMADYYKIDPKSELIVVSDDIDLEPGQIRIRCQGSAGGQNGLKNIIQCLGTQDFIRIRVGTGKKPEGWDLADWVLSRFSKDDRKAVDGAIVRAAEAAAAIIEEGAESAMTKYNRKA